MVMEMHLPVTMATAAIIIQGLFSALNASYEIYMQGQDLHQFKINKNNFFESFKYLICILPNKEM